MWHVCACSRVYRVPCFPVWHLGLAQGLCSLLRLCQRPLSWHHEEGALVSGHVGAPAGRPCSCGRASPAPVQPASVGGILARRMPCRARGSSGPPEGPSSPGEDLCLSRAVISGSGGVSRTPRPQRALGRAPLDPSPGGHRRQVGAASLQGPARLHRTPLGPGCQISGQGGRVQPHPGDPGPGRSVGPAAPESRGLEGSAGTQPSPTGRQSVSEKQPQVSVTPTSDRRPL